MLAVRLQLKLRGTGRSVVRALQVNAEEPMGGRDGDLVFPRQPPIAQWNMGPAQLVSVSALPAQPEMQDGVRVGGRPVFAAGIGDAKQAPLTIIERTATFRVRTFQKQEPVLRFGAGERWRGPTKES
jgi:hypothetical protein